jgi:F-type H+-transporting ATPase subunit a
MSADSHSPLDQFKIQKLVDIQLGGFDLSFTNSSLYMLIATIVAVAFMVFSTRKKSIIPSRAQLITESVYGFLNNMVQSSLGDEGRKFFPLIFCLFTFILMCNILGMTPYSFTATSHVAVTFTLSMFAFLSITIFAIVRNGIGGFVGMFLPSGVPWWMAPIIFLIEFFSFLIRPVTLSVRLFANIVAGHVLLKVVASFIVALGVIFGILPMAFAIIMTGFELFVAVLQSYIFAILVCAYLGEVTRAH